jgi:histidinol phosphatase-like PHP family hydrolase
VDARYTVRQHAQQAKARGIDWLVITDHGRGAAARPPNCRRASRSVREAAGRR